MENNKKDPNPPAHKDEKVISPVPSPVEKPTQPKKGNATSQKPADSKTNNNQSNSSANSPVNNSRRKAKPSSWWIRLGVLFSLIVATVAIAACYWLYLQLD